MRTTCLPAARHWAATASKRRCVSSEKSASASEQVAKDKAAEALASETAAKNKATEAEASADMAKRYCNGGVVPEDAEDNAEWYYKQTKDLKAQVDQVAKISIPHFYVDPITLKLMSDTEATGMRFWYDSGKFYGEEINA